nr:glycosyltransferase family 4 protein [Candidatus Woesebacteria bacterium]
GMTHALSEQNTQIYFTLPYALSAVPGHMHVLECSDPAWFASGSGGTPPFFAYSSLPTPASLTPETISMDAISVLPTSELESKVDTYAELVTQQGIEHYVQTDVIHAHDWMSFPAAMKLSQTIRKPFVAHIHSTELDRIPSGTGSEYIMQTEYEGMVHATRVIAVSYYTKRLLVEKYGIAADKIDVVHNGIVPLAESSMHSPSFAQKRPVVVFMGRLTAQKGAEYFIALARKTLEKIPEALFIVAGDGDMYHELLFKTAQERLSASVLYSGFVRDVQRARLLDRADVFVMPSLSEPFGLVALEAAQRRTPVIISKNAGVSEVLPSSISIDFWDINKMASEITRLVGQPAMAKAVVTAQLHDLEKTTWEDSAIKIRDVYNRALLGGF